MPIPAPSKKEKQSSQQKFISRCMGDSVMNKEYPDSKQRAAICYSQWKRSKKHKQSRGDTSPPDWDENDLGIATFTP